MPLREINGVRLLVEESGRGDPLVLVHGSWDDRSAWELVEEELARSFRVVSYDRRGHSASEDGDRPGTRRDDEDDLASIIETLGPGPAHVAANSFGASIALGLAGRRPELFRSLAAHEPPLMALAADDPAVAQAATAVGPVLELIDRGQNERAAESFVNDVAVGPGGWALIPPARRAMLAANAPTFADEQRDAAAAAVDLDALGGISVPVLLTHGDQSPPFFARVVARLAEAMPTAAVTTLDGEGHVPHMTAPGRYVAMIREFALPLST